MSLFDQLVNEAIRARGDLVERSTILTDRLKSRYALPARVSEPVKVGGNVSTWKLVLETRPGRKHLPAQRINLDICAIPSHDPRPMILRKKEIEDLFHGRLGPPARQRGKAEAAKSHEKYRVGFGDGAKADFWQSSK